MSAERKALEKYLRAENAKWPVTLQEVPRGLWPDGVPHGLLRVFRSRRFLVQEFQAPKPARVRLSVNVAALEEGRHRRAPALLADEMQRRWIDGITWDDLQRIKRECGYGEALAFEVFPPDLHTVCVANMRHIWIMEGLDPFPFVWRLAEN